MRWFLACACIVNLYAMDRTTPDGTAKPERCTSSPDKTPVIKRAIDLISGQFGAFAKFVENDDPQQDADLLTRLRTRIISDYIARIGGALDAARELKQARPDSPEQKACIQKLKGENMLLRLCHLTIALSDGLVENASNESATPSPDPATGSAAELESAATPGHTDRPEAFRQACASPIGQ